MPADLADAFESWLAADRRHRGAYLRARAALFAIEDALSGGRDEPSRRHENDDGIPPALPAYRRPGFGRFALTGALAASVVGAVGIGLLTLAPRADRQAPAKREMLLADGSVATLGDGARIAFSMADGTRKVLLLQGEAVFHVAKDREHPFVVRSGDVYAQATGTVYSVRRVGKTGGAVKVNEGSVLVWGRDDRDQAVLLHPGGALTLEPGPRSEAQGPSPAIRPASPPPEVAQIALDNVSIATAATRFNRINRTQIVVADPAIGQIRIVGLFRANDPVHFAKAAAAVADADIEIANSRIVIKEK